MPRPTKTRRRSLPAVTAQAKITIDQHQYWWNPTETYVMGPYSSRGAQLTVSESHKWPPVKGEPLSDRGGNFYTRLYRILPYEFPFVKHIHPITSSPLERYTFEGHSVPPACGLFGQSPSIPWPPDPSLTDSELDAWGTKAIARCAPGQPVNDFSTSLGELMKEGLPSLIGVNLLKSKKPAAVGGEYLNYQFGIAPVMSDVKNFLNTVRDADRLLAQYERDAGRVVRRRYRFPMEQDTTEETMVSNTYPQFWGQFPGTPFRESLLGKTIRTRRTVRKIWFSGAFTYHLPTDWKEGGKIKDAAQRIAYLYGVEPTPEMLWNLAPWSWAADWFANTGDYLSNVEAFKHDGLVMRYGYVMCHSITSDTFTFTYNSNSTFSRPYIPEVTLITEIKQRREATPFGFGLTFEGFDPFKLSILAALGISRKQ